MKAKLINIIERDGTSNRASKCYILCFRGEDGKPYRTWTDDSLGNFKRWYNLIVGFVGARNRGEEVWLDGLIPRNGRPGEVDADSQFKVEITGKAFVPNHQGVTKQEVERKDQQ